MKAISGVSHGKFGVSAVDRISGEERAVTKIFFSPAAVRTLAAGRTKPRNADPVAGLKISNLRAFLDNPANDFVTRDEREFWVWQFAINDVQIRAAHSAGIDSDQDLVRCRYGNRQFPEDESLSWLFQNHGSHGIGEARFCRLISQMG
jgi:hypothetical protein